VDLRKEIGVPGTEISTNTENRPDVTIKLEVREGPADFSTISLQLKVQNYKLINIDVNIKLFNNHI